MRRRTAATIVPFSLSLTPVQNKNHDAAQVWDHNCGRLFLQIFLLGQPELNHSIAAEGVEGFLHIVQTQKTKN